MPSLEDLGLPDLIADLAREERVIILITETTGSGKYTTLVAILDLVCHIMSKYVVTIEDPMGFLYHDDKSIINQRDVGSDRVSYARALRRVLRQDQDNVLIGEIRDSESTR